MVRTRTIDLAKETFWREQMEPQAASSLSIAAWCRQNQVAITSFHYSRRTLARSNKPSAPPLAEYPFRRPIRNVRILSFGAQCNSCDTSLCIS